MWAEARWSHLKLNIRDGFGLGVDDDDDTVLAAYPTRCVIVTQSVHPRWRGREWHQLMYLSW